MPARPSPGRASAGGPEAGHGERMPPDFALASSRTGRSRESRRAEAAQTAQARTSRAGRNLPAAIGVGVLLAAIVLGSLFVWRPAFVG